jgi:uncharacterized protein YbjT (DUF2867 family)
VSGYTVTVVGATGKTGRYVVKDAIARGWNVHAATRRRPAQGQWMPFSWDDRASWLSPFVGSDAAYLLIPFNHPAAPEATPDLIRAVAAAGVPRISLLSSIDAEHAAPGSPLRIAEETLAEMPVRSAILRPTWFLDNFTIGSFAAMTETGELRLPAGEGRIPFIDARDVAAVAVASMAEAGPDGVLPLTGPTAIDHHEVATTLSEALGRSITYAQVAPREFIGLMTSRGFPRDYAEFLSEALADIAEERLSIPVWDTVDRVCGRPAYSAADFAQHFARQVLAGKHDPARH